MRMGFAESVMADDPCAVCGMITLRTHMNRRTLIFRLASALPAWLAAAGAMAQSATEAASPNRKIYMYQGADRDKRLVEQAKKEGQVMLYSTMTVADGKMLAAAFEK